MAGMQLIDEVRQKALTYGWRMDSIMFGPGHVLIRWVDVQSVKDDVGTAPDVESSNFQDWVLGQNLATVLRTSVFGCHESLENALKDDLREIERLHALVA